MLFRVLLCNLNLWSILGAFLLFFQTISPTLAQSGNQSDATNPGLSNFSTVVPTQQPVTVFQGPNAQPAVNQAATSLISGGAQTASQQSILNILGGGGQSSNSINAVTNALSTAPGAPPAEHNSNPPV